MVDESTAAQKLPHELGTTEAAAALGADSANGLTTNEVESRLAQYGQNELPTAGETPLWLRFFFQFRDIQVHLLLVAALVSLLVWKLEQAQGPPYEALAILAIVLLNAVFGFLQEERASRALAALKTMSAAEASVIRNGQLQRVEARSLVPGDLLIVQEGDRISADARLLQTVSFHTQEAELTGESTPVLKSTAPLPGDTLMADRVNMIFSSTTAVSGHAKAVVTATGTATEVGRVATLLHTTESTSTPLQTELEKLGRLLGLSVLLIAIVVVATLLLVHGIHQQHILTRALLFGIALAVAATPEGLAAVVTVVLALGMERMARRGAIVRHLHAVETLGQVTVIASDKTGTMTLNQMQVRAVATASGEMTPSTSEDGNNASRVLPQGSEPSSEMHHEHLTLLKAAALCNNARLQRQNGRWEPQGDPTEAALLFAAMEAGIDLDKLESSCPRLSEAPFSSQRKRMSTIHRCDTDQDEFLGPFVLLVKGAPDLLLNHCTQEMTGIGMRHLDEQRKLEISKVHDRMADHALRILAVAMRPLPTDTVAAEVNPEELEQELVLLGLVGMLDPPRPEAIQAVAKARSAGVRSIMITGDHAATAMAIAHEMGIATAPGVLTGKELAQISDEELSTKLRTVSVFARVEPAHKLKIVRALQHNHEIVAMTGDGVNDAPALRAANIGVAMGITGTDVAREAADFVLTDDNFATIVAAIEEGRALFDNIRKFLRYLLSTNFGEILTLFVGVLFAVHPAGAPDGEWLLPLLAAQILWINLITDGAPALALGMDPPEPDVMRRAPRPGGAKIIDRAMLADIGVVAIVMAAGTLLIFFRSNPAANIALSRSLAFTTLILYQLINTLNVRSDLRSGFSGMLQNKWLWSAILGSLLLQVLVLDLPVAQRALGLVALSPAQWIECTAMASLVLWIVEMQKAIRRFLYSKEVC